MNKIYQGIVNNKFNILKKIILLLGIISVFYVTFTVPKEKFKWGVDDVYISLRYAKVLADEHVLSFNFSDRVQGFTNLGWVLINSIVYKLNQMSQGNLNAYFGGRTFDVIDILRFLNMLLLTFYLLFICQGWKRGFIAALAITYFYPLLLWAGCPLETLAFAISVGSLYSALYYVENRSLLLLSVLSICLLRFDGFVWIAAFVIPACMGRREKWTDGFFALLLTGLTLGSILSFSYFYYGDPLSNTFYVKKTTSFLSPMSLLSKIQYYRTYLFLHALPAIFITRSWRLLLSFIGITYFYLHFMEWMPGGRYLLGLAAISCYEMIRFSDSIIPAIKKVFSSKFDKNVLSGLALVFIQALLIAKYYNPQMEWDIQRTRGIEHITESNLQVGNLSDIHQYFTDKTKKLTVIAQEPGAISFFMPAHVRVIDFHDVPLNNKEFAKRTLERDGSLEHYDADFVIVEARHQETPLHLETLLNDIPQPKNFKILNEKYKILRFMPFAENYVWAIWVKKDLKM